MLYHTIVESNMSDLGLDLTGKCDVFSLLNTSARSKNKNPSTKVALRQGRYFHKTGHQGSHNNRKYTPYYTNTQHTKSCWIWDFAISSHVQRRTSSSCRLWKFWQKRLTEIIARRGASSRFELRNCRRLNAFRLESVF